MGKRDLRVATQILTGHADLNNQLPSQETQQGHRTYLLSLPRRERNSRARTSKMPPAVGTES